MQSQTVHFLRERQKQQIKAYRDFQGSENDEHVGHVRFSDSCQHLVRPGKKYSVKPFFKLFEVEPKIDFQIGSDAVTRVKYQFLGYYDKGYSENSEMSIKLQTLS